MTVAMSNWRAKPEEVSKTAVGDGGIAHQSDTLSLNRSAPGRSPSKVEGVRDRRVVGPDPAL
jgi:hypothetical protein